jgi:hypothetical protein
MQEPISFSRRKANVLLDEIRMELLGDRDLTDVNGGSFLAECNVIAPVPDIFATESIGQLAYKN